MRKTSCKESVAERILPEIRKLHTLTIHNSFANMDYWRYILGAVRLMNLFLFRSTAYILAEIPFDADYPFSAVRVGVILLFVVPLPFVMLPRISMLVDRIVSWILAYSFGYVFSDLSNFLLWPRLFSISLVGVRSIVFAGSRWELGVTTNLMPSNFRVVDLASSISITIISSQSDIVVLWFAC